MSERNVEPYIGLDFDLFEKIVSLMGDVICRVVSRDGSGEAYTADYRANRINLVLVDNKITKAWWG